MSPVPEVDDGRNSNESTDDGPPEHMINASSSDSDGFETIAIGPDNYGYTVLPQDPEGGPLYNTQLQEEDDEEEEASGGNVELDLDAVITHELNRDSVMCVGGASLCQFEDEPVDKMSDSIWNQPPIAIPSIPLDEENVDAIKKAMAGFQIPLGQQPRWASSIQEDSWKEQLLTQIQQRQDFSPDNFQSPPALSSNIDYFTDDTNSSQTLNDARLQIVNDTENSELTDNVTKGET